MLLAIIILLVLGGAGIYAATKFGFIKDADGDGIPDVVEDKVKEVKEKAEVVKTEIEDVVEAAKEVVNQAEDVVEAVKGKKRQGRPRKKPQSKK